MKNKKFINLFQNIEVSKELDNKILNETINKPLHKNYKYKYALFILILISFLSVGIIAYCYMRPYIVSVKENTLGGDSINISINEKVKIKRNAKIECSSDLTLSKLEDDLGIKFLNIPNQNKNTYNDVCDIKYDSKNRIRTVSIRNEDDFKGYGYTKNEAWEKKYMVTNIKFMTNYANEDDEKEFKLAFDGGTLDPNQIEKIHLDNIDIDAYIILTAPYPVLPTTYCVFVYNNILYSIRGENYNREELIEDVNKITLN